MCDCSIDALVMQRVPISHAAFALAHAVRTLSQSNSCVDLRLLASDRFLQPPASQSA